MTLITQNTHLIYTLVFHKMGWATAFFCLLAATGFAQRGPGGVSIDTDNQRNCRLWLDAGDLSHLADGDSVTLWIDKSVSEVLDSTYRDPLLAGHYTYPVYRNTPAMGINGKPVVSYESGGMLGIGKWPNGSESSDLNSDAGVVTTYEQTIFIAFRTSNDIASRQILWEEGGAERGINTYLYNGEVYIGAYDFNAGDEDVNSPPKVPRFGFIHKKLPVQPNTTYVLAFKYDVPKDNTILTNPAGSEYSGLTGSLNGQPFPYEMLQGSNSNYGCNPGGNCPKGVGGIYSHPDPVGVGGINQGSYHESGRIHGGHDHDDPQQNFTLRNKYTGTELFTGRIAEIVYYAYALNAAEQIIVENYLAAKYFANVIQNDKFSHKSGFGDGVIGIGRQTGGTNPVEYNHSQGDNLFEISVDNMSNAFSTNPQYLLVGHNNAILNWTSQNTPDSASIQRLQRIWRWDQTGGNTSQPKDVKLRLHPEDIAKLPPLPPGFTKYGVILGDRQQSLPKFTAEYGRAYELAENNGVYEITLPIRDDQYLTLCAIKPVVQFEKTSDFAVEGDVGTSQKMAKVILNYTPTAATSFQVEYEFVDGTAVLTDDYLWNPASSPLNFPNGMTQAFISFEIVNDATVVNDLPIEDFTIHLTSATNGITIGAKNVLTYTIYDNDPPPKVSFAEASGAYNEGAGTVNIPVGVLGELTGPATATVEYVSGFGTATPGQDFTLASPQVLNFSPGSLTDHFTIHIVDDITDEYDETFKLRITGTSGDLGFDETVNIEMIVTITDNDLEPTVSFVSNTSEGFEVISDPHILVHLSNRSAKEITVPFSLIGGTATNGATQSGADYDADPLGGVLVFSPGDSVRALYKDYTTGIVHIVVYGNDESPEDPETIIFELDADPVNATLGSITQHTYTIIDYTEFEWQGIAGVGKLPDNTIWMVPDAATSGGDIPNLSPRPIQITQSNSGRTPVLTTRENGLNHKRLLAFDGVNDFLIPGNPNAQDHGQSSLIQTANTYNSKSMFFVIVPDDVTSTVPQVVFEAGAQRTGMTVYILGNTLYFMAWGWQDNLNQNPLWGLNPNAQFNGVAYTEYTGLTAGTPYIINCNYENNLGGNATFGGLSLFVNGALVDTYDGVVGVLRSNPGAAALGAVLWQSRFQDTKYFTNTNPQNNVPANSKTASSHFFKGKMGDFMYYNEPQMNKARIGVINNFLSARYNIPLTGGMQAFNLEYADNTPAATNEALNHQVAGIGRTDQGVHGDSRGEGELRIRNAVFNAAYPEVFLMFGNNGKPLTSSWPTTGYPLPAGIVERSEKIWRITGSPSDGVSVADLHFDYGQSDNAPAFMGDHSLLKLLIHHNADPEDFGNAIVLPVTSNPNITGPIAFFSEVPISDGMFVTLGNTSATFPLPIELLGFSARLDGERVILNWSTASEIRNDYFQVERAGPDLSWKQVLQVPGAGHANTTQFYREIDPSPLGGVSYYRLKQVDYDGGYSYSDVVSVLNLKATDGEDIHLFPNPTSTGGVFVRIPHAFSESDARILLFDLTGRLRLERELPGGGTLRELRMGDLPKGVYFVRVELPHLSETKKLVIR